MRGTRVGVEDSIELCYFALPNEIAKVELRIADWSPLQISDGVRRAGDIVVEMRTGRFPEEEPGTPRGTNIDGIDRILRSGALEFDAVATEAEGEE